MAYVHTIVSHTFVSMSGVTAASAVVMLHTGNHMKALNALFLTARVSVVSGEYFIYFDTPCIKFQLYSVTFFSFKIFHCHDTNQAVTYTLHLR